MKEFTHQDWVDKPITGKQKALIEDMIEHSIYPLPPFTGSTRGEASDYINKYAKLANEDVIDDNLGDLV